MPTAVLQRFVNIRRDEAGPALVPALFFFCVLTALMVVRPARTPPSLRPGARTPRS